MDLVFFGIQGSGKGTQAKKMAAEFGYYVFEAGGELRRIKDSGTELGETVKSYIDAGKLVPFEIIMNVMREAVQEQPPEQKILFDGIPRDMDQMHAFNDIMEEANRGFRCLHILLPEEKAVERILGRAREQGRADDGNEQSVRQRMELFREKTVPVIETYASQGNMVEVDGEGTEEEVYERIVEALGLRDS